MRSNLWISPKLTGSAALLLFALSAVSIEHANAQSQDSREQELQQLKEKLQSLDQTMEEVRAEISAM
jgi:cell division protein FtsB